MKTACCCVAIIVALTLAMAPAASAEERPPRRWEFDVRAAYVVLGDQRTTGGIMPQLCVRHAWRIGEASDVAVGAQFGIFGIGGEARWIGTLGGPTVGASVRPWRGPVALGLTLAGDFGRIPVCNNWGLCLRYGYAVRRPVAPPGIKPLLPTLCGLSVDWSCPGAPGFPGGASSSSSGTTSGGDWE